MSTRLLLLVDAALIGAGLVVVLSRGLLRYLDVNRDFEAADPGPPANTIDTSNG